ncbi:hypothetical protein [Parashewanella tropica]|uniref:hypothetical protein n=1 Tax=Parashewanella tropica TaxID=2547970 RepID=UPI00105940E4|nr:hypothetical protein [Parashewanella tropica]
MAERTPPVDPSYAYQAPYNQYLHQTPGQQWGTTPQGTSSPYPPAPHYCSGGYQYGVTSGLSSHYSQPPEGNGYFNNRSHHETDSAWGHQRHHDYQWSPTSPHLPAATNAYSATSSYSESAASSMSTNSAAQSVTSIQTKIPPIKKETEPELIHRLCFLLKNKLAPVIGHR